MQKLISVYKASDNFFMVQMSIDNPNLPPLLLGRFDTLEDAVEFASDQAFERNAKLNIIHSQSIKELN